MDGPRLTVTASDARILRPGGPLLAMSILLPLLLFGLAAWRNYDEVLAATRSRVEKGALIVREHTLKVFETHSLVIDDINERLERLEWSNPVQVEALHDLLLRLAKLPQIATILIVDREGRLLDSNRKSSTDPVYYRDRDWFVALKESDLGLYVSQPYPGRMSGLPIFNIAARIHSGDNRGFEGIIAVSVDREYFENFFRSISSDSGADYFVTLARQDGRVLARYPGKTLPELAEGSVPEAGLKQQEDGTYMTRSPVDGIDRIYSYYRIGNHPVFVTFGITLGSALQAWRHNLIAYGVVAGLAAVALLALSRMAIREAARERTASARWQETAQRLELEIEHRARAELALVQAQKMEAIGQLTGGIAHDFNNMLTAVIGNLEMILRRVVGGGDEKVQRWAELGLMAAERAAGLTQRLLVFARRQSLESKAVDVNDLVAGMIELLRTTVGETTAISIKTGKGLWRALADPHQLESALLNLAINARDAMPNGGLLTIETSNSDQPLAKLPGGDEPPIGPFVMISVTDDGEGMTQDVLDHVFEPFFTTKPVGTGTGLGLPQVYGFVRQSGGHVSISSEPGLGTCVKLYLPRAGDDALLAEPAMPVVQSATPGGPQRILVVEDNSDVREFTTDILRQLGHSIVAAEDGPKALQLLDDNPAITLLFTDVGLPGMNGRELAAEVQRRRPDIKILFTTGYAPDVILQHGLPESGEALITKPFSIQALADKISNLMRTPD
jgi:two-component system NtrC family sensor kinase